jgi:hypothetical protein
VAALAIAVAKAATVGSEAVVVALTVLLPVVLDITAVFQVVAVAAECGHKLLGVTVANSLAAVVVADLTIMQRIKAVKVVLE